MLETLKSLRQKKKIERQEMPSIWRLGGAREA